MKKLTVLLAAFTLSMAACNGGSEEENQTENTVAAPQQEATAEAIVTLNAGDDMKFDLMEIRVKEGQQVKLTLHHTGKLAKDAMGHNFVLLAAGVAAADFANEAINASSSDYVPASSDKVIAHTKLLAGGESDTIEFPAPPKGTYEFLCSFPGHVSMMKGQFIVE